MNHRCTRAGCGEAATASLSFDYDGRTAWLVDVGEPTSVVYGLCRRHADGLRVPVGWSLTDQRAGPDVGQAQAS